jgi:hypothetical protein
LTGIDEEDEAGDDKEDDSHGRDEEMEENDVGRPEVEAMEVDVPNVSLVGNSPGRSGAGESIVDLTLLYPLLTTTTCFLEITSTQRPSGKRRREDDDEESSLRMRFRRLTVAPPAPSVSSDHYWVKFDGVSQVAAKLTLGLRHIPFGPLERDVREILDDLREITTRAQYFDV